MTEKEQKKKKNEWLEWIKAILLAVAFVFIVRMFLFAPIVVEGPSMLPTLHDRDQMIVNKIAYTLGEPDRFDIVVFHAPEKNDFIKRIIGLPGEHVEVKNNVLYIDGEPIDEPFLNDQIFTNDFKLEELEEGYEVVPEDSVFVMGDNRSNSTDSRIIGVVPMDEVVGKAKFVYWPLDRIHFSK